MIHDVYTLIAMDMQSCILYFFIIIISHPRISKMLCIYFLTACSKFKYQNVLWLWVVHQHTIAYKTFMFHLRYIWHTNIKLEYLCWTKSWKIIIILFSIHFCGIIEQVKIYLLHDNANKWVSFTIYNSRRPVEFVEDSTVRPPDLIPVSDK